MVAVRDSGETHTVEFGNFQNIHLSGYKWLDSDGDGS
jgi:hypothetical protein